MSPSPNLPFSGRVALVTGGASGIGLATVKAFLRDGAKVLIVDRFTGGAKADAALASAFESKSLEAIEADVSSDEDSKAYVARCLGVFGRLDIAVLSAGICPTPKSWMETDVAEFDKTMAVNVKGIYIGVIHIVNAMRPFAAETRESGGGAIVFLASTAGLRGSPLMSSYAASKWAVRGMSLTAAQEFAPFHIRCNSVAPGAIETNMYATSFSEEHKARTLSKIPMGVLGQAEDVAETIIFLASPEASYVSGAMFGVHGGAVTS